MEHFYAELPSGIKLHCVSEGPADAPLMLFVHGFPEFWLAWKGQLKEFGRDHRAVAFDLRGHNLSDKPEGVDAYRVKPLLEDLKQLIEHLRAGHEDKSCILVAHDWGGAIAWTFAAAFAQYVRKLVIINAPHTVPFARALAHDPTQREASHYMLLLRHAKAERVLEANNYERLLKMFSRTADGHCALTDEEIPLYRAAWSQPGALTCALNLYRASPLYPPTPEDPGAAALKLDPARSELFSGAGLHGQRRIQEANGKPIQKKGTAAPGNIKSALVPHRISRPKKLQGAVMGEDASRMHRHRHEERIRAEIFNQNHRWDDGVYLPGHAFQSACLEMVFEPIHDTRALPSPRQNIDGLVERKYRMGGKKIRDIQFSFGVHIGNIIPCYTAKRQHSSDVFS